MSSVKTDQCYYAKTECLSNVDLKPECEFLAAQSLGDDLSFFAQCKNGFLSAFAFKGQGCTANSNSSNLFNKGEPITIPVKVCMSNVSLSYIIPV